MKVNFDGNNSSPFEKAKTSKRRLKLFLWGDSGSGKTTLALHFPNPAVIDMEGGTELYGDSFDFKVFHAADADEVSEAVSWLANNKHDFRTLIIDPITVFWDALQKKWSDIFLQRNKAGKGYKHEFYDLQMKDWSTIKAEFKEFIRNLVKLDMNVILTAREKTKYAEGMRAIGETFDGEKTLPYIFDTTVQLYLSKDGKHMGTTLKDRTNKLPPKGQEWEVTYDIFQAAYGDILTKKAKIQAQAQAQPKSASKALPAKGEGQFDVPDAEGRATKDQILQITMLGKRLGFNRADLDARVSDKYNVKKLEELPAAVAEEIIQALEDASPKSELEE